MEFIFRGVASLSRPRSNSSKTNCIFIFAFFFIFFSGDFPISNQSWKCRLRKLEYKGDISPNKSARLPDHLTAKRKGRGKAIGKERGYREWEGRVGRIREKKEEGRGKEVGRRINDTK